METRSRSRRRQTGDPCNCLRPLIRFWGLVTAIVLCGVGVDISVHGYETGIYILVASGVTFFLEIKWVLTLFIQLFFNSESSCCVNYWSLLKYAGGWRLAPLYIAIGVALHIWPHNLWLSYVAGTQLIILAILRLLTIFRFNVNSNKDEGLLPEFEDSFDKYDNLTTEVVDDSIPETVLSLEDEEPLDEI